MCGFWDCHSKLRRGFFLCSEHYRAYKAGRVDKCPGCQRYKDAKYDHCLDCRPARRYQEEHSEAWEAGDAEATAFYVYVLKLNDGRLYAGQTRELRERLMEHQDGLTKSTARRDPKLVWFTTVDTRETAAALEVSVKKLCDRNPREVRRWIIEFKGLVDLLDFT